MEEGEYFHPQRLLVPRTKLHLSKMVTSVTDGSDPPDVVHETQVMSEENSQVNL